MQNESNSVMLERMLNLSPHSKIAKFDTWESHHKIMADLKSGDISIPLLQNNYDQYINHNTKEQSLKKIFYSDDYYNYERDQKILLGQPLPKQPQKRDRKQSLKEEDYIQKKKHEEQAKKEFIQKMKIWGQQKVKIAKRKRQAEMKKQMMHNSSEEKRKKDEKDIEAFLKLEKKKVIEARIEEIQQRKHLREERLQESSVKRSKSVPRYLEYEKQFKSLELKKNLQQQILMKNRKASLQMDMQKIKEHEKAYIQRIKQRLNIKSVNNNKSQHSLSKQQEFNVRKKDKQEMKKIQEKIKRIKKFEDKLKLVPLKIDNEKKKERQILQDKLKNPKKYNFLSQKALSDEQIFDNFKEFDINIDFKDIGNNYMEEVIQRNKVLKPKVSSQKVFPVNKPEYKNYLEQMRLNKKQIQNPDQFDTYAKKMKSNKYKEHGKDFLKEKSDIHYKKALQSIIQLQKLQKYPDSIRKEQQIDDNYAKALRAKIALAKLT